MRHKKSLLFLLILAGCAFVFLTGCPMENGDDVTEEEELEEAEQESPGVFTMKDLTVTNGEKLISLSTGKTVSGSKKNTTQWDIMVKASMYVFRTNSGVTAADAESGGNAYIWYVNKTDFNSVTLADRVDSEHPDYDSELGAELAPYAQDITRYYMSMDDIYPVHMNIMTYFGFDGGDGLTRDTHFSSIPRNGVPLPDYIFYHFNKKAAYEGTGGMPPGFKETKQIYIIRHADGVHHSKFQVTAFQYGYAMDLKFAPLD